MRHTEPSDHALLSTQLGDFAAGRLAADAAAALEAHVAECADCRDWLATYRLLGAAARRHLPAAQLAAIAAGAADAAPAAAHLGACGRCAAELDTARAALAAARAADEAAPAPAWRLEPLRLAAAAVLLLVLGVGGLLLVGDDAGRPAAIEGNRVLEGESEIVLTGTRVASGAELTVRAGEMVALGEGFSLADGASLTIEVEPAPEI